MAFLADGELAERALNRASPLDREHKRLALKLDQKRERSKMKTFFVPPGEFTQFDPDRLEVDLDHKKLAIKTENKGHSR